MNFDDFIYNTENIPENYDLKALFFEDLKNKFYDEIKNNRKQVDYFNTYNPDSVENFMLRYASQKAKLVESYEYYTNESYHNKELKYREVTEKVFDLILQKKLWNLQLQWRANLIDIKEISTTWDFSFWEDNISSCPFIPMVTDSEVEIMKQYLSDPNHTNQTDNWFFSWQNYNEIMQKDEEDDLSSMPDWYEFYDTLMGTDLLLQLPDIKGEKEEYYENIGQQYYTALAKKEPIAPKAVYVSPPPHISCSTEEMLKYAQTFEEDKHFVELFSIYHELIHNYEPDNDISDDAIDEAIELLKEAEFPVPITAHSDWRAAIIKSSQQYINSIVIKEIDVVYEEYKMLSEIGLSKNNDENVIKEHVTYEISELFMRNILKGRELCNEPQDFDY